MLRLHLTNKTNNLIVKIWKIRMFFAAPSRFQVMAPFWFMQGDLSFNHIFTVRISRLFNSEADLQYLFAKDTTGKLSVVTGMGMCVSWSSMFKNKF